MAKIQFRNKAHRDFVFENLEKCRHNDCYHQAFFYVMGISEETRMNIGKMFDFKNDCIVPEGMYGGWQTSGTVKVCHLAFNLWNGFTEEGNLIHPAVDDGPVLEKAREAGVSPVLTLTPIGSDGHFNNHLVSALVRNADRQQRLLWEIGAVMLEKGYEGLDIDFEYVLGEDREAFAAFVERSARLLHVFGYVVRVALAPKTSSDQKGLLYEGIDYRLLGEAADQVLLMTYEWGYSQGPPMAVAPLPMVRRVVEYALTQIPREKILLGMPNYGYDWPLPYERGVTRARSLGLLEAVELAVWYGVKIEFDQKAQSPYFRYWQYGVQHEVWFEDPRSILAKYGLIREYGLYGFGVWQLMRFFRAGWLMMEELFRIDRG